MVVIKTKEPINKVFFKTSSGGGEFVEGMDAMLGQSDPLDDERVQEAFREEMDKARAEWETDAAQRIEQAREQGLAQGRQEAESSIAERGAELASVISSLAQARDKLLDDAEEAVLVMSLAIARRFVEQSALLGDELIRKTIKEAVKLVTEKEKVIIRVNPDDLDDVRGHQDDIIFIGDGIGRLEVRGDKQVDRGGCVVETEAGNIDARLASRFGEIDKALRQAFNSRKAKGADEPSAEQHE